MVQVRTKCALNIVWSQKAIPQYSAEPGYCVNATHRASRSLITSKAPARAGLSYFFADKKKKSGLESR